MPTPGFAGKLARGLLVGFSLGTLAVAGEPVLVTSHGVELHVDPEGTRFGIRRDGYWVVEPHPEAGVLIDGQPADVVENRCSGTAPCELIVTDATGYRSTLEIREISRGHVWLALRAGKSSRLVVRVKGAWPGYGLGDHACVGRKTTDITGFDSEDFRSGGGLTRLVSNFTIYPRQGFAFVVLHPGPKIVKSTTGELSQGAVRATELSDIHFFLGDPREIYRGWLEVRNRRGYPVTIPDYTMFGVGWEAWGALGWRTSQQTVLAQIRKYLDAGYPLRWAVIGSGFWPRYDPKLQATTSFGMYDPELYPDPGGMIAQLHDWGLKVLHGLRISFIDGGPFTAEGVKRGFFLAERGRPILFRLPFPQSPCYLLDAQNPSAVDWYVDLTRRWVQFGVDGFKEDLFGYREYQLRDDKVDPVNWALKRMGLLLIQRNGYVASLGDLHRIEDFNYDQDQDRGPLNCLALAYSGLPLVYPDVVGGTFAEGLFDLSVTPKMKAYLMRNARWAALHPAMAVGKPPWEFRDAQVERVVLEAARLHDRLQPYFYSQAVRFAKEGFPWPLAPLPLHFPDDEAVYARENTEVRGYQWMIGDALLATPLYGNDYGEVTGRDVYLPRGTWVHYDTGRKFIGPVLLRNFPLPLEHSGLFVGGTGIVVEKSASGLVCRVYPITPKARTVFWHRDGYTRSEIQVRVTDWNRVSVVDLSAGELVSAGHRRGAVEFALTPGHHYMITSEVDSHARVAPAGSEAGGR